MLTIGSIYGERFRVVEAMGLAWPGMGRFIAEDLDGGEPVVLHAVAARDVAPATRLRVADEAVVAGELDASALIPVVTVGGDDEVLYHVMPWVEGELLADRLRAGPLSVTDTLGVAAQVATALIPAHERGMVHRSITPSHVVLGGDGQVRLEGFGCIRPSDLESNDAALALHRARYASPEEAGLLQAGVDGRADLYSLGVMMYQCLTGRLPFDGGSVGELLRLHLTAPALSVRHHQHAVPRIVDELVGRLLQKAPEQRYQSARAVVTDVQAIQHALQSGQAEPELVLGLDDRRQALASPSFVGRSRELAALERELVAAKLGNSRLVVVEAASGGGKSRLLEELTLRAAQQGMWLFTSRGSADGAVSYQTLQEIADSVVRRAEDDAAFVARLRVRLGDWSKAACEALPTLRALFPDVDEREFGLDAGARTRTRHALSRLLAGLGQPECPAVILIDDAQWLDSSTLDVITAWAEGEAGPEPSHTVVVLATRAEDARHLGELHAGMTLVLDPLGDGEIDALLSSMAGALPDRITALVTRLSGGSPFLAASLLRALVDSGALVRERAGWGVQEHALADAQSSPEAAVLLRRRMDLLSEEVLEILQIAAVLGRRFDAYLVASLSERDRLAVRERLDEACLQQILWADANLTSYQFVHEKLRDAVLERVPEDERRRVHTAAACELERQGPHSAREIAYHFDAGGEPARALPYALAAAEEAQARHALDTAEAFYRIALRGEDTADPDTARRVRQGLADVLVHQDRFDEAEVHLAEVSKLASSREQRIAVESLLGRLAHQRSYFDVAVEHFRRSVRMRGVYVPERTATVALLLLWEVLMQVLHTLMPRLFVGRRPAERSARDDGVVRDLLYMPYGGQTVNGLLIAMWSTLRAINLAERYPPSPLLGECYLQFCTWAAVPLGFHRVERYARPALDYCRRGNLYQEALSHGRFAQCAVWSGRCREGLEHAERAIRIFERAAGNYELNSALSFAAAASLQLGNRRDAERYSQRLYDRGVALGDSLAFSIGLVWRSYADAGRVDWEEVERDMPPRTLEDPVSKMGICVADGLIAYYGDHTARAVSAFERVASLDSKFVVMVAHALGAFGWYATVLRRAARETPAHDVDARRALLDRAYRVARFARKGARSFPLTRPRALRELGVLAAIAGKSKRARRLLDQSVAEARRLESRLDEAYSLWMRGEIGRARGWDRAEDDLVHGRALLRTLGADHVLSTEGGYESTDSARPSLSLVDRFAAVQEQGRCIASALTRDAVFAALHEAGVTLLRGDQTTLLYRGDAAATGPDHGDGADTGGWQVAVGDEPTPWCLDLVARVAELSCAQVPTGAELGDAGEIRSALCAPVEERGRCVAVLLVVHHQIEDLFGEEERRLSEFIATLASAALENAAGFAESEELGRTLERRVAERTAELATSNSKLEDSLRRLHDAQRLLLQASREAGMAEVAVGVLHNVGNALNSLTVSTELLAENLGRSPLPDLIQRSAGLLLQHSDHLAEFLSSDPRGQKLPDLLGALARRLATEYGDYRAEVARAREQVEHVTRIIRAQQRYARTASLIETVSMSDLIEEALSLCANRLERHGVTVVRERVDPVEVELDRHKLMQVLINLLNNAVDALDEMPLGARRITLRACAVDVGAGDVGDVGAGTPKAIRIDVEDNGRGIDAEVVPNIFRYGFSTKDHGHGFGLHSSALAMQEQGGSLRAASDGPGRGACFTLELPLLPTPGDDDSANDVEA
ncbi:AAA family ATPase [Haliangium sp.]|uniref:AAA family ATPase n=1 Tax=Haliangium sp. TaxID=2663208 RepID=UPI003D0B4CFA